MSHAAENQHTLIQEMTHQKGVRAFTLVELLIVVVILGILATVVIPLFSSAAEDAKLNTMVSQVAQIRRILERYKIEHNGEYPPDKMSLPDPPHLLTELTTTTEENHISGDGDNDRGPYLLVIPTNPFTGTNYFSDQQVDKFGNNASAWFYLGGVFKANDCLEHFENY